MFEACVGGLSEPQKKAVQEILSSSDDDTRQEYNQLTMSALLSDKLSSLPRTSRPLTPKKSKVIL